MKSLSNIGNEKTGKDKKSGCANLGPNHRVLSERWLKMLHKSLRAEGKKVEQVICDLKTSRLFIKKVIKN